MSLADLAERAYGPFAVPVEPVRVADFVAVTGDDGDRWHDAAPPGFAAAVLFSAAPSLLESADVAPYTRTLIHSDQSFTWHGPLAVGATLQVTAAVASVRERGDLNFVVFEVGASDAGSPVLTSSSTFLLAATASAEPPPDEPEPAPLQRSGNDPAQPAPLPAAGEDLPVLSRSASRLDLVRYAAAGGDWNPIHWDHGSARAAGLPGIVVHGLLMAAWITQAVARFGVGAAPVSSLELRFRRPLRPAAAATVSGRVEQRDGSEATLRLELAADGERLVTGRAAVRVG